MSASDDSTPFSTLDEILARLDALGVGTSASAPSDTDVPFDDGSPAHGSRDAVDEPHDDPPTDIDPETHPVDDDSVIDLRTRIDLRAPTNRISDAARLRADETPPAAVAEAPTERAVAEAAADTVVETHPAADARDLAPAKAEVHAEPESRSEPETHTGPEPEPETDAEPQPAPESLSERLPTLDLRPSAPVADVPPPKADGGRPKLEIVRPDGWTASEIESLKPTYPPAPAEPTQLREAITEALPPAQLSLARPLPRLAADPVDISRPEEEPAEAPDRRDSAPAKDPKSFNLRDVVLMCLYAAVVLLTIAIAITLL